ncbi:flagellar biosynthesis protein FlhF [Massilia eurypsychrophila]|uniref:Flagellar biosynthesis protein FlhF n=1 Tax=Massilia eurypsychrophila TaxID=1485217 RepID=A0A2G8TCE2_9BURK|nr:flagellar biosynthesis protein FlhF [Massilia eurypsychrophila]PIL43338.1 flagellar biosynthesis protein FlhF [Massilia eurypsychrophila]
MNVKKFTAATSREALRKVRDALGPDAVILSNRPVDGVVEILALANDDVASISSPAHGTEMAQPAPALQHITPPEGYANRRAPLPQPDSVDMAQMSSMMAAAIAHAKDTAAAEMSGMMSEIRAMRGLMETQLAAISWGTTQQREPEKAGVLREMLAAGFSATLARYLIEKMPSGKDAAESMRWIKTVLCRNLTSMTDEDEVLEKGGVFALVGPTGVGKTTSTAKLAARCVMRHGPEKLALITTDAYRIGGHEQLRIYGKILGVMVHSVKDEADLRIALKELRNKHTVLIDTVGVSQRDQMVTEQVAMLSESGADVKRLLCLNATSTNETLNEVVRAYQGSGLAGCIMTKMDEAASIGNVLDVVIRQKLRLFYISNGQRVPEDLHLADRAMLVDRAFRLTRDNAATQYADNELPLLMAQAGNAANDRSLRGVSLG